MITKFKLNLEERKKDEELKRIKKEFFEVAKKVLPSDIELGISNYEPFSYDFCLYYKDNRIRVLSNRVSNVTSEKELKKELDRNIRILKREVDEDL